MATRNSGLLRWVREQREAVCSPDVGELRDKSFLSGACLAGYLGAPEDAELWEPEHMADSFASRFAEVRARWGPLVWGLDPSGALLDSWGLGDSPDGLERFADLMLDAAIGTVGLVKPQSAFYERHGWRGIRTLQRLVADARAASLLVILDTKRGDIGTTNEAYAEAYLGEGAPLQADALTLHPYLGLGAMDSFVTRAHEAGACLLVVTRSTNPEGRVVQAARGADGRTVEAALLSDIGDLNASLAPGRIGPIGAVVGAAQLEPALDLSAAHALFLAPGVGAQGATAADVAQTFAACPGRVMPSASRLLLSVGPDKSALRDAAAALADEIRNALAEHMQSTDRSPRPRATLNQMELLVAANADHGASVNRLLPGGGYNDEHH